MKALILSANAGQGHNSCAEAIREVFAAHGDVCVIEDTFGLLSKKLSRAISNNHEKTYRNKPRQNAIQYRFLQNHPELFTRRKLIFQVMSLGSRQVTRCVREGGYDVVICTHALAGMMLTASILRHSLSIHSAFVATDYSCSPGVSGMQLDRYFIPHASITQEFEAVGIPAKNLVVTGIPVRQAFTPTEEKADARQAFGILPQSRHLLLMCGSMGCGPIPDLLHAIAGRIPQGWEISVVCGTNTDLRLSLLNEHGGNPALHIHGYVKDMPCLLHSADLYLTKPGGLSTAEAVAAAVPMVLVDAVAGCEASNLQHFVQLGAAVTGDTTQEVADACLALMQNPDRLNRMTQLLQNHHAASAAEQIWQEMNRLSV